MSDDDQNPNPIIKVWHVLGLIVFITLATLLMGGFHP
jgi:hypothetical protein